MPPLTTPSPASFPKPLRPILSFGLFLVTGIGFGLLFDRTSLSTPFFWVIFFLLLPFFLQKPSSSRRGFAEGMAFGLAANLLGIRWLLVTMEDYGHLPALPSYGGLILFAAYLALFPALFRMATARLALWTDAGHLRARALLVAPALWIITEAGRTEILTGFPWNPLGSLLFGHQALVLPAQIVGATGLSFLIVAGAVLLARFFEGIVWRADLRPTGATAAARGGALFLFFLAWVLSGKYLESEGARLPSSFFPVALIQGNIPPDQKWSLEHIKADFRIYRNLSQKAVSQGARLLVWPETALPVFYDSLHPVLSREIAAMLFPKTFLLTGAIGRIPDPIQPMGLSFTNAAILISPDGHLASDYVKQHLVPFGEYLPLPEIFGWLRPLIGVAGDMARGHTPGKFSVSPRLSISPLICYEALYPSLVRKNLEHSTMIAVISDDAWFGRTSAPYQLFRESAMRSVENGVPMLRAANTGLSGVVLSNGQVLVTGPLFSPALLQASVPLSREPTFYRTHGEWVLKGVLLGLLFWRALLPLLPRKGRSLPGP